MEEKTNLRNSTIIFLVKKENDHISEILLAMKKRGFGQDKWNGTGGKVEPGETIEQAACREALEEIGVSIEQLQKMAEIDFFFPDNPAWNQKTHIFLCDAWQGQPIESEEMKPQWFDVANIPLEKMWVDDEFWLPEILAGKKLKANISFNANGQIQEKDIQVLTNPL